MGVIWRELFPTKLSIFIFFGYMSLFVCQGLLVTYSQESNSSYKYNTVVVVLLTEVTKLFTSCLFYLKDNNFKSLLYNIKKDSNILLLYFVPAFLYCLYNNLAFINLSRFDPTTYYLLLQFRVVITGFLFQVIFKKNLSKRQWMSLVLLTAGCMLKQIHINEPEVAESSKASSKNMNGFDFSLSAVFILAQTVCSCLAGVYNEYLLKDKGVDVNIFIQNVFMYIDSIVCNIVVLIMQGDVQTIFYKQNLTSLFSLNVILIIINNSAIGIITSFFLKYMNSILKTFASAIELMFTAVLCYFLFAIPIYINTILAISVVSIAIYLYSQNPVLNMVKRPVVNTSERENFLDEELDMEEV
ncbi:hypothetical protein ACFFRR_005352 [Megaselia abdita]